MSLKLNMAKSKDKTNVMRVLDQKKVPYVPHTYPHEEGVAVDGVTAAEKMGKDPATVFKTLVTRGASGQYHVFVIPVCRELDLKAAARACGEKSVAMIPVSDLLPLTGYLRGGCSPIGMKKSFDTTLDQSAEGLDTVTVSAGRIGWQVELTPADLASLTRARFAPVTTE